MEISYFVIPIHHALRQHRVSYSVVTMLNWLGNSDSNSQTGPFLSLLSLFSPQCKKYRFLGSITEIAYLAVSNSETK